MKIAFDVHGVLDRDALLRSFVNSLTKNPDLEIFIISGPPSEQISSELVNLEIYTTGLKKIISVVDFLTDKGIKMRQDENGNWWCDDIEWWASKAEICKQYGIDIIFDDKIEYATFMPYNTRFILWEVQNRLGELWTATKQR